MRDALGTDGILWPGERLTFADGRFIALMQTDGNFVVYPNQPWAALWASSWCGQMGFGDIHAVMQSDGNFVLYSRQLDSPCTGSDSGQTAFYPPGHNHTNPTIDRRNTAEDFDGFKDTDGCPEADNDNDAKQDANDTCPGNDNLMGADGALGVGGDQNHNGIVDGGETWAAPGTPGNDDSVQTFEDYDGILDTDGCHDSPGDDADGTPSAMSASFRSAPTACALAPPPRPPTTSRPTPILSTSTTTAR